LKQTAKCSINIQAVELAANGAGCVNTAGRNFDGFPVFQPIGVQRLAFSN